MGRRVVCRVTGEVGTSDTFVKINGKYYKSQEIYDDYCKEKNLRMKIIGKIYFDLLEYEPGQPFPTIAAKKLSELNFYSNEIILKTLESIIPSLKAIFRVKKFKDDNAKISYIFAALKNHINDIYHQEEIYKKKMVNNDQDKFHIENMATQLNHNVPTTNESKKKRARVDLQKWGE